MVYNVHGLRAGVGRIADALAPVEPDLVLLQECGPRRRVCKLAGSLEMDFVSSHRGLFARIRNAVLFRRPWRLTSVDVRDFSREGRRIPRGFIALRLRTIDANLTAVSAHFGLSDAERVRHAGELTDYLAGVAEPLVVGADVNEDPDRPAARWLADRLFDAFSAAPVGAGETFPAASPAARIDYLFVNQEVQVVRARVLDDPGLSSTSDHLPVLVDATLPESSGRP